MYTHKTYYCCSLDHVRVDITYIHDNNMHTALGKEKPLMYNII